MKLIFASSNENKLIEIRKKLGSAFDISSLSELNYHQELEETAQTLNENALMKAEFVSKMFQTDCFADDTGLEVEALNNLPGVYSARYAGEQKNSYDNCQKLLKALDKNPNRKARFVTVIALIIGQETHYFEGRINGFICEEMKGNGGFGYDPVFIPEGFDKTFAEMSLEEKNQNSHRAIAIGKMQEFLRNLIK